MKCLILFSEKNKKIKQVCLPLKFAQRVVKVRRNGYTFREATLSKLFSLCPRHFQWGRI